MAVSKALTLILLVGCIDSMIYNVWNKQNQFGRVQFPVYSFSTSSSMWSRSVNGTNGRNNIATEATDSVADNVIKDLDISVNPCTNFYQFTCGGYIRNQTLDTGFASKILEISGKVSDTVRHVVEEVINYKTDSEPLIQAKTLYRSCLNEGRVEMTDEKAILSFIQYMGGWPTLGMGDYKRFNFESMLAKATPFFGVPGLSFVTGGAVIGLNVLQDFKQNGRYLVYLDQPVLGQRGFGGLANYELYFLGRNSLYAKAYIRFGIEFMIALGAKPLVAKKDMNDIYSFESKLSRFFLGEPERRRVQERYHKLSIFELSMRYPGFNWLQFLNIIGAVGGSGIRFGSKDHVVLWAKPYYDGLFAVLKKTPRRVLANYITFRAVLPFIPALGRKFQNISLRYDASINGAKDPSLSPRNNFCAGIVVSNMQWLASRIIVQRKLTKTVLSKAIEIKNYIRHAFRREIATSKWLDKYTRQNALRKFDMIKDNIGFPDYLLNGDFLDLYYRRFDIKGINFFEDMLEVYVENFVNNLRQLTDPQFDRWILTPAIPNAAHERGRNAIVLTAAILAEPLIRGDYPPAMVFGAFGWLVAHEYQHAFDSAGIQFNGNGLIQLGFWSPLPTEIFNMKAQCFIKQYSNYFLTDFNLPITNGLKTLDEDLCDNVGLKTAYNAYQAWKTVKKYDDRISGLPFTGDQLLFINYGRSWCSKWSKEFVFKFPLLDWHSLNRIRAIGPLQNSPEFSRAFHCPLGSFMNPKRKCSFW